MLQTLLCYRRYSVTDVTLLQTLLKLLLHVVLENGFPNNNVAMSTLRLEQLKQKVHDKSFTCEACQNGIKDRNFLVKRHAVLTQQFLYAHLFPAITKYMFPLGIPRTEGARRGARDRAASLGASMAECTFERIYRIRLARDMTKQSAEDLQEHKDRKYPLYALPLEYESDHNTEALNLLTVANIVFCLTARLCATHKIPMLYADAMSCMKHILQVRMDPEPLKLIYELGWILKIEDWEKPTTQMRGDICHTHAIPLLSLSASAQINLDTDESSEKIGHKMTHAMTQKMVPRPCNMCKMYTPSDALYHFGPLDFQLLVLQNAFVQKHIADFTWSLELAHILTQYRFQHRDVQYGRFECRDDTAKNNVLILIAQARYLLLSYQFCTYSPSSILKTGLKDVLKMKQAQEHHAPILKYIEELGWKCMFPVDASSFKKE
jgi:hypothetical protein